MVEKTSFPELESTAGGPLSEDMTLAERLQVLQKKRTAESAEAALSQKHQNSNQHLDGVGETIQKNEKRKSKSSSQSSSPSSLKSSSSSSVRSEGKRAKTEDKRTTEKRSGEMTKIEEKSKTRDKTSTTTTNNDSNNKNNSEIKAKVTIKPKEKAAKKPNVVKGPPATTDSRIRKAPNGLSSSLKAELMMKRNNTIGKQAALPKLKPHKTKNSSFGDEDEGESSTNNGYQAENDGTIKWTTLEHNGIYFPPPYEPHGVAMYYNGKPIALEPEAEEVATFFAGVIGTDHYDNPIFRRNFWEDFCDLLVQSNSQWQHTITEFEKCDFTPIHQHLQSQKEKKKAMTKDEKKRPRLSEPKLTLITEWPRSMGGQKR